MFKNSEKASDELFEIMDNLVEDLSKS